jgi:anti-sigma regulatory factor (Ser/Thr protein kinase)
VSVLLDHAHVGGLVRLIRSEDFAVDPRAAGIARRLVRQACHEIDESPDIAELLVSELVTNAVLHAETPCRVTFVALRERPWWVEVQDWSLRLPAPRHATLTELGGRGYELVDTLAHWHIDINEPAGVKVVCFTPKGDTDVDAAGPQFAVHDVARRG